jgi:aminoglycoside phosphotransferase (APT) family kinase protein
MSSSPRELDPLAVLAALDISDAVVIARLTGGADTALWRIERNAVPFALRVFRPEQAATARREVVAMQAAMRGGIPVPRVVSQGVWADRPALLLSWCAGRTVLQELEHRPWEVWRLGTAFGRMQARMHSVPAPQDLDADPFAWIAWTGAAGERLQAVLRELSRGAPVLLHLDFHPLNVLAGGPRITAVLDWANARSGDRRADVARTLTILRFSPGQSGSPPRWRGPDEDPPLMRLARQALGLAWRRGYEAEAGPLGDMAAFYAWAGAVMLRDLGPRTDRPSPPPSVLEPVRRWSAEWERASESVTGN